MIMEANDIFDAMMSSRNICYLNYTETKVEIEWCKILAISPTQSQVAIGAEDCTYTVENKWLCNDEESALELCKVTLAERTDRILRSLK